MSKFNSVVFDVDSTLTGIEGIDWLAARRSPVTAAKVADLTAHAMEGKIELDSIYGGRLNRVRPSRTELEELGEAYVKAMAPGARDVLHRLSTAGVAVHLVSGGLRIPVERLASELGVIPANTHAVDVFFDGSGGYSGYDEKSPLTRQTGKREIIESLRLPRPILAVGDGMTDLAMRPAVDGFAAFTGFVSREGVVAASDYQISKLDELISLVIG